MNILFYTVLFVMGITIGSLWATKASELPKEFDLRKTHYSNNPKAELISKLTYILMGGISTVVLANIFKVNIYELEISNLIIYIFAMIYISTLVIIAGIDKNYSKIEKKLLAFGIVTSIIYMIYLFLVDLASIYLSIIYLGIYMILLLIDSFLLRKFARDSYLINVLMLLVVILVFTDLRTLTYTLVMATIAIIVYAIVIKSQEKKSGSRKLKLNELPVGFFIGASNVIVLFMIKIFECYII